MSARSEFLSPRASDVQKPLALLRGVPVVEADGIGDRRRDDVAKDPVQGVVLTAVDKRLAPSKLGAHVDGNDDWPLKALRTVDRDNFDRFAVGIQPRLIIGLRPERTARPVGTDVLG